LRDRVIVIGGAGVFGTRLSTALAREPGVELVVAGRDLVKAGSLARRIGARALRLDRGDAAAVLMAEKPFAVVDAAGPFQRGAGDDYPLVRAALARTTWTCRMMRPLRQELPRWTTRRGHEVWFACQACRRFHPCQRLP
jgi:short subunit dehydrogenase-like uncharacterized protein